ncbi:hypothetical protein OG320_30590 [Microbispora sp. NBC_01189]|nr:hypothetical protein OG320_30590 [Microbispora sp. NBC_01189]
MFKGVIAGVVTGAAGGGVAFDPGDVATDEIWTYDRVPGAASGVHLAGR